MKREDRIRTASLVCSILIAAILTAWVCVQRGLLVEERAEQTVRELSWQVLRFHVLADSDDVRDQQVKLQVKEAVIAYLKEEMGTGRTLRETRDFIASHLDEITATAEGAAREAGSTARVTAALTREEFPEKTYGDVTFPPGEYEALKLRIGSGNGRNWWCCLYPNLCFTDAVHAVVDPEDKSRLASVLDEDAYDMLTSTTDIRIKWFFLEQ